MHSQFRMGTRHGEAGERSPRDRYAKRELAACKTLAHQSQALERLPAAHTASANLPADCATA